MSAFEKPSARLYRTPWGQDIRLHSSCWVPPRPRTAIVVIKEDIHDRAMVETVKRFADVVLEFRDQDDEAGLKVEMRTLNFADNIYTSWRPFNDWLRPISVSA